jgi:ribosome modulation factor
MSLADGIHERSERKTLRRAGVPIAEVLMAWRRHRAFAKQDAFVKAWKTAWGDGCRRRWEGGSRDELPYLQDDHRAAWVAGWQWADAHPDRRRQGGPLVRGYRRSTDRRGRFARRGLVGLTLVGVAGWWWRRRGLTRTRHVSLPAHTDDSRP